MTKATRGKLDNPDLMISKAYVGGEWKGGDAKPIEVEDPFTLKVFAEVPTLGEKQAQAAVGAAEKAFPDWAAKPAAERGKVLRRWSELIAENKDDLARLMTLENGKTFEEAKGEVDYGNGFMQFYAQEATRTLGEVIPADDGGKRLLATREPAGVTAAITPWNFPLAMLTRKVGPALAAGCTMVAKPASMTPLTALAFAKLGEEAGVPRGVFSVVTGGSKEIGGVLTKSQAVRVLSFTGSTGVGVKLYEQCAGTMKRLGLELGGNAPLLIFDDADLDTAVEAVLKAKFRNAGQSCIAANRIYVQDGIRDRLLDTLKGKVAAMTVGDGFDEASDIGPLIDDDGVEKVKEHLKGALDNGATCLAGGGEVEGRMFPPTLIAGVPHDAQLTCEETFGPLAGVIGFDTMERGLELANDTPFGLAAYMCSSDPATIAHVSRHLQSGMVGINTGLISNPHAPFGGVKMSGLGREGSHHGIEEFLNIKYLCEAGL